MNRRARARLVLCVCALASACPMPDPAGEPDGGARDASVADAGSEAPDGLASLDEVHDVATLAGTSGGVKYLAPVEDAEPRPPLGEECAFQNTARYPYHLEYLRAQAGGEDLTYPDYLALVLRRDTRVWWGGEVRWRPNEPHPLTSDAGVLAYTLYTEDSPGNRLEPDDVRAVYAALTTCAPAFAGRLAFLPSSNEQQTTAAGIRETLASEGIAVLVD